jgi:hypothetical protein
MTCLFHREWLKPQILGFQNMHTQESHPSLKVQVILQQAIQLKTILHLSSTFLPIEMPQAITKDAIESRDQCIMQS